MRLLSHDAIFPANFPSCLPLLTCWFSAVIWTEVTAYVTLKSSVHKEDNKNACEQRADAGAGAGAGAGAAHDVPYPWVMQGSDAVFDPMALTEPEILPPELLHSLLKRRDSMIFSPFEYTNADHLSSMRHT